MNEWRSRHDRQVKDPWWINILQAAGFAVLLYIVVVLVFAGTP